MKRVTVLSNQFRKRYVHITCKKCHATNIVRDLYNVSPTLEYISDAPCDTDRTLLTIVFSIPFGTCDSEITLIDNIVDYIAYRYEGV